MSREKERTDEIAAAFRAAWLECIDKHEGTLATGPCDTCCEKHATPLRARKNDERKVCPSCRAPLADDEVSPDGVYCRDCYSWPHHPARPENDDTREATS